MITHKRTKQQKLKNPQTKLNTARPDTQLTFLEHAHELRRRVFYVALVLVVASVVGIEIKDQLIALIVAPLHGQKLVYLTPGGGFNFIFTLSIYFGALFTIPVVIYHMYRFVQPILKKPSRRFTILFLIASSLLAITGALMGYFLAIPGAMSFLNNVGGDTITPNLTADSYLRFVITYIVGLAVVFQIPLILFLFDRIRPIPPGKLASTQRYAIIATSILAALITPSPDLTNYFMVLVPIITLYEIGVIIVYLRRHMKHVKSSQLAQPIVRKDSPIDEPLTAIIEELQTMPEPVANEPDFKFETEPAAAPAAIPQPVTSVVGQQPIRPVKSIDGFGRPSRSVSPSINVPARSAAPTRLAPTRATSQRPLRSIEGFL